MSALPAFLLSVLLSGIPLFGSQQEPIALAPGEFRWIPITVRHTPIEVECSYRIVTGGSTVHVELLGMRDFHRFNRDLPHGSLAVSPTSREGAFRRMIDEPGQYALVVVNGANAPPATVSFEVSTDVNPAPRVIARELTPRRRLTVILISFAIFFVTILWSGIKLIRAVHKPAE